MPKISIRCFKNIDDAEPEKTFEGEAYQAVIEHPAPSQAKDGSEYARVILNPDHEDPKKSVQIHIRAGERNGTDPLRFARVEVYEAKPRVKQQENEPDFDPAELVWYGDIEGNTKPVGEHEYTQEYVHE